MHCICGKYPSIETVCIIAHTKNKYIRETSCPQQNKVCMPRYTSCLKQAKLNVLNFQSQTVASYNSDADLEELLLNRACKNCSKSQILLSVLPGYDLFKGWPALSIESTVAAFPLFILRHLGRCRHSIPEVQMPGDSLFQKLGIKGYLLLLQQKPISLYMHAISFFFRQQKGARGLWNKTLSKEGWMTFQVRTMKQAKQNRLRGQRLLDLRLSFSCCVAYRKTVYHSILYQGCLSCSGSITTSFSLALWIPHLPYIVHVRDVMTCRQEF